MRQPMLDGFRTMLARPIFLNDMGYPKLRIA